MIFIHSQSFILEILEHTKLGEAFLCYFHDKKCLFWLNEFKCWSDMEIKSNYFSCSKSTYMLTLINCNKLVLQKCTKFLFLTV